MKLFVTGGTGFLGSHFVKQALAKGHSVVCLRRDGSKPRVSSSDQPQWIQGDLEGDYSEQFKGCDALVHFAAVGVSPQVASWNDLFRINLLASLNLWNSALDKGVGRLVICGSCMEYGKSAERYSNVPVDAPLEPVTGYAASKAAASTAAIALAVERKAKIAILRPFTVYGEGQHPSNFLPALRAAALSGADFPMTLGEQVRDFQPVERCASDFLDALDLPLQRGVPYIRNLGTGKAMMLCDFARERWSEYKAKGELKLGALPYRPNEVMRFVPQL